MGPAGSRTEPAQGAAPEYAAAAAAMAPTVTATSVTATASLRFAALRSPSVAASYFSNGFVGCRVCTRTGSASLANRSASDGAPTTNP